MCVEVPTSWTIFMRARAQYGNFARKGAGIRVAGNFNWKLFTRWRTRFDLDVELWSRDGLSLRGTWDVFEARNFNSFISIFFKLVEFSNVLYLRIIIRRA